MCDDCAQYLRRLLEAGGPASPSSTPRMLAFSIVCVPRLACEVTTATTRILPGVWDEQVQRRRDQELAALLFLRQRPGRAEQAHRRPDRLHLQRMRRAVHGHHQRGE